MISDIVAQIVRQIQLGISIVEVQTTPLINILLGLDVAVFLIMMALGKNQNIESIILKIMSIGVMFFIINNFAELAYSFERSISQIAIKIVPGVEPKMLISPSAMLEFMKTNVFDKLDKLIEESTSWQTGLKLQIFYGFTTICVTICFCIIAGQIGLAYIFFHLTVLMGLVLMPFNMFEHTKFIGAKVFPAITGAAIKIGMITILAGVVVNVFDKVLSINFPEKANMGFLISLISVSGMSAFLSIQAPKIATGLLSGMPALSFSGIVQNLTGFGRAASQGGKILANRASVMASATKNVTLSAVEGVRRAKHGSGNHLNKNFR